MLLVAVARLWNTTVFRDLEFCWHHFMGIILDLNLNWLKTASKLFEKIEPRGFVEQICTQTQLSCSQTIINNKMYAVLYVFVWMVPGCLARLEEWRLGGCLASVWKNMFGRRLFLFFDLCGCGGSAGAAAAVRYEKWRCTSLRLLSGCTLKPTVYFIPCLVNRNKTRKYFPVSPPPLLLCYANY